MNPDSARAAGELVLERMRAEAAGYGECDLLIDHPGRPGFWMDTLAVWGQPPALRCEPSLIEKPE